MSLQEEIAQTQSRLMDAYEQNKTFEVCTLLDSLSSLHLSSGFERLPEMNYSLAAEDFTSATKDARSFRDHFEDIVERKLLDEQALATLKELLDKNEWRLQVGTAYALFCTALFNNLNRNPGLAVQYFAEAEKEFAKLDEDLNFDLLAKYCGALKYFAEGFESFMRANFGNAKTSLQRAKVAYEKLLEQDLPALKEKDESSYAMYLPLMTSENHSVRSFYFMSDARYQFNSRNFKVALKQFTNVVAESESAVTNFANAGNMVLMHVAKGDYHMYLGWRSLADAEVHREAGEWDKALSLYEQVKKDWEDASESYLVSGHPSAPVFQETVQNYAQTVDMYQAVCEKEMAMKKEIQELQEEIDLLKGKLFDAIKPMGVTINNSQDMVNTIEQNVQIIQHFENKARESVQDVMDQVKKMNLDEAAKKKIEAAGNEVLQSKEKGPKFFDKVKSFTKDVAEVIKNVGEIAAPLVPVVKFLSGL